LRPEKLVRLRAALPPWPGSSAKALRAMRDGERYLDTSFLAPLLREEAASRQVEAFLVEFASLLARRVHKHKGCTGRGRQMPCFKRPGSSLSESCCPLRRISESQRARRQQRSTRWTWRCCGRGRLPGLSTGSGIALA